MTRAAIYARFSTDLQSARSIEDQFELCRVFAVREHMTVCETYADHAKSGSSIFGRDGLLDLMVAAKARAFDVLLVEHFDRIARSMRDLADIHEKMAFYGISIRAVHSGAVLDTAMVGLLGLVGQMQREDGAKKVRRGMSGVVREGRHAGGRAYGYRAVAGAPGELEPIEEEAAHVRRIFEAYAAGEVPRDIARKLNADFVPAPHGGAWNASTINGSAGRGNGILRNQLYVGRNVWNKVRMVKNPETGRRVSRVNAAAEREEKEVAHLAIVSAATFDAVQARLAARSKLPKEQTRAPKRLLSGLLKCGACGAGMSLHDRDKTGKSRIRCTASIESGTCSHGRKYYVEAIEALTVEGLKGELRKPRMIAEYVATYQAERKRLASDATNRRIRLEKRLGEIDREIDRLVDAIATGSAPAAAVGKRLMSLEADQLNVKNELDQEALDADVVALHPAAITRYLAQIEGLSNALTVGGDISVGSPAKAFRELVESVVVYPVAPREPLQIEIKGYLAELTDDRGLKPACRLSGGSVVAEEGLEPPTRGL